MARLAYRSDVPYTVGLTGAPGAGKSTLTDRLITEVARPAGPSAAPRRCPQVGVLAVDPTSPFSGGAILGDRVRMSQHALDPTVFIRSMATRGHLGGLSLAVPDAVRLLGAAGLGVVIVETVGVGQMEVEIASAADTTVVVVTPGLGRLHAGQQGRPARGGRRVRHQQGGPAGRARGPRATSSRCSTWRGPGPGGPRSSTRRRPPARASPSSGAPWPATATTWSARASWRSGAPTGWPRSCAGCCWPAPRSRIDELAAGEEFTTAVKALAAGELDPYQAADRLLAE